MATSIPCTYILGTKVSSTSYEHATEVVSGWAGQRLSKYVCVAPVNTVMEAHDAPLFRAVINGADLVTPDGVPVVWGLKLLGNQYASRVYGPDLTLNLLEMAERERLPVGFYGGTPEVLGRLSAFVARRFPLLTVAYAWAPPFRPLTCEEDQLVTSEINASGTLILFVGLGGTKQDYWMAAHRPAVRATMVGVGAAFDFLAGTKAQAPLWMRRSGFEWVFRLATEPRRLWKRYLKHNPRYVVLFAMQLMLGPRTDSGAPPDNPAGDV